MRALIPSVSDVGNMVTTRTLALFKTPLILVKLRGMKNSKEITKTAHKMLQGLLNNQIHRPRFLEIGCL